MNSIRALFGWLWSGYKGPHPSFGSFQAGLSPSTQETAGSAPDLFSCLHTDPEGAKRACQGLPIHSLLEAASYRAGLTHTSPRNTADDFTNQLLQDWGWHKLLPGGQSVFVTLWYHNILIATILFFLRWLYNSRLARAELRVELAHLPYVNLRLLFHLEWVWS